MGNPVTAQEKYQITWIAKVFYRCKKRELPFGFGPLSKMWIHFVRARLWMKGLKTLGGKKYKTFIMGQFHCAPDGDRDKVYPNWLYGPGATLRWRKYLAWKTRRLRGDVPGILEYEKELSPARINAVFEQGAWDLEGYLKGNYLTEDDVFRAFHAEFYPHFILAAPDIWSRLEKEPGRYGDKVKFVHEWLKSRPKAELISMRRLYAQCRAEQAARWRRGFAVRSFQLQDLHVWPGDLEEDSGPVGSGSEVPGAKS